VEPASQPLSTTPSTSASATTPVPAPALEAGVVIEARFVDVGKGDCEILIYPVAVYYAFKQAESDGGDIEDKTGRLSQHRIERLEKLGFF
jgi:hypothetical protein